MTGTLAALAASLLLAAPDDAPWLHARPGAMDWWREARFGMFIHWGPVSLRGTEIGWSRGGERPGIGGRGEVPLEEYDNLWRSFDPVDFDADEWVALAKAAGMKYLVFTTKHHDGFPMFDSAVGHPDIMDTPFGRDIVRELADACHRGGLRLGFYYSPPDWRHPDYLTERHASYIEYLHEQLRELCANYGAVDIIWFDGLQGSATDWDSPRLFEEIRALQPEVLINNRAGLPGDFGTPEQTIGRYDPATPWESCITICQQWAWRPDDNLKSLDECVGTLVRCAGGDGNLLLNVGPMPTGAIEPRQVERLRGIGKWLRAHGETIYGTRGGPFRPGPWGATTCRGEAVYVHVLDPGARSVVLPPMDARIVSARVRAGGSVEVAQSADRIVLDLAERSRHALDTIVELRLDRPALEAVIGRLSSGSLAAGRPSEASNVHGGDATYGPERALDDDPDTRWATDWGTHAATLTVDLGAEVEIGCAFVSEEYDRVSSFRLERQAPDGGWVAFHEGTRLGHDASIDFPPVTARMVRLNIIAASEGPTLWEFQLYPPAKP